MKKLIGPWIPAIRNHFWYAVANCDGDELCMRVIWLRFLQHICGDHTQCDHGPMEEPTEGKSWLEPDSPALKIIREEVMKESWLKSFSYYTKNRHTGLLEVDISKAHVFQMSKSECEQFLERVRELSSSFFILASE